MACQALTAISDGRDGGMTQSRIARCGGSGVGNATNAEDMEFLGSEHSLHLRSLVEEYFYQLSCTTDSAFRTGHSHVLEEQRVPSSSESRLSADKQWSKVLEDDLRSALHVLARENTQLKDEVSKALRKAKLIASTAAANGELSGGGRSCVVSEDSLHTAVVQHLRRMGFDAAVCHCQREQEDRNRNIRRDFPAEGYTYVDVILHKRGKPQMLVERIIVDVRFRDEFKIARPTAAYAHLLKALPATYVGTSDTLRRILKLMSMAMQKSMEEQGMPLPPWRTFSFLESKWLSRDYSRTVLPLSNHAGNPTLRFAETISSTLVASRTEDAAVAVKPNFPSTTQNPCCQLPNPGLSKDDRNFNSTNCGNVLASHLSSLYKENGNTSYGDRLSPSNEQETLNRLQKSWKLPLISVQFPYHTKGTRKRVGALTMALKHASSDEITVCNRNAISYGVVSPAIFC